MALPFHGGVSNNEVVVFLLVENFMDAQIPQLWDEVGCIPQRQGVVLGQAPLALLKLKLEKSASQDVRKRARYVSLAFAVVNRWR